MPAPLVTALVPTGYAIDASAVAGLVGAVAGAALGAYVAWRVQQGRLERERGARTQARRLPLYAAFDDACRRAVAAAGAGAPLTAALAEAAQALEMLRSIASPPVRNAANLVYATASDVAVAPAPNVPALLAAFRARMAALRTAMRAELGAGATARDAALAEGAALEEHARYGYRPHAGGTAARWAAAYQPRR